MSSEQEDFFIAKHLDIPEKILFWTVDELMAIFMPVIFIGFLLGDMLFGWLTGGICLVLWKRFKGNDPVKKHYCMFYWFYPAWFTSMKGTPASHIRKYFG